MPKLRVPSVPRSCCPAFLPRSARSTMPSVAGWQAIDSPVDLSLSCPQGRRGRRQKRAGRRSPDSFPAALHTISRAV